MQLRCRAAQRWRRNTTTLVPIIKNSYEFVRTVWTVSAPPWREKTPSFAPNINYNTTLVRANEMLSCGAALAAEYHHNCNKYQL